MSLPLSPRPDSTPPPLLGVLPPLAPAREPLLRVFTLTRALQRSTERRAGTSLARGAGPTRRDRSNPVSQLTAAAAPPATVCAVRSSVLTNNRRVGCAAHRAYLRPTTSPALTAVPAPFRPLSRSTSSTSSPGSRAIALACLRSSSTFSLSLFVLSTPPAPLASSSTRPSSTSLSTSSASAQSGPKAARRWSVSRGRLGRSVQAARVSVQDCGRSAALLWGLSGSSRLGLFLLLSLPLAQPYLQTVVVACPCEAR